MNKSIIVEKIIKRVENYRFLVISGNGGSGKTTIAKSIKEILENGNKKINIISMDDFIVDTTLRNNSETKWSYNNQEFKGRYTSCCKESYFLRGILPILHSLRNKQDIYYLPKRSDVVKLFGNADLTIIEGIGSVFLPNSNDTLKVWLECDKNTEITRRINRDKKFTKKQIEEQYIERTSQFKANIEPFKDNFDIIIDTSI